MNTEKNIRKEDKMELDFYAYETYCMIKIEERPDGRAILEECRNIALEVEKTLNMYDYQSELSIMNRKYQPGQSYHVSGLLFNFIKICIEMARVCKGAFDPTIGALVKEWKIGSGKEKILSGEWIEKLLKQTGYGHVDLRPENNEILIDIPGIIFDAGAAGKGYALDLVVEYLKKKKVMKGCLDFGGNLYVLETMAEQKDSPVGKAEKEEWRIGIRHPDDPKKIMACVMAKNKAISTSSWYEHYFVNRGKRYCHLLNPATGFPVDSGLVSVTIISSKGVYADILSTAFYVLGEEKGKKVLEELKKEENKLRAVIMKDNGEILEI